VAYTSGQIWGLFLDHMRNSTDENLRHWALLLDRDRIAFGLKEVKIRERIGRGTYGEEFRTLWEAFRRANEAV
jgi:hypothetical protein